MEREAQQKQLKLSAPEKTDKNPNRKIHHLPPSTTATKCLHSFLSLQLEFSANGSRWSQ